MSQGALDSGIINRFAESFSGDPANLVAQNVLSAIKPEDAALNRRAVNATDHSFSVHLDDWSVTAQNASGRCWIFAGLNVFRPAAMKKMNLKEFEFSQNFVQFWNKLERINYVLETMIETADRPVDDRTISYLLDHPLDDGGQWNMFADVVRKHGLVPRAAMPESFGSSNSAGMNKILTMLVRRGTATLREAVASGEPIDRMRQAKEEIVGAAYRVLAMHLGEPPRRFTWQWKDKDNVFHRDEEMTPHGFAESYLEMQPHDFVTLVNDPRPGNEYLKTFTVEHLANVVGGEPVKYLNVPVETLKSLAIASLEAGRPVWFGCDMGKMMNRTLGVLDPNLYEYEALYRVPLDMTKASRLLYHQTAMSHAMVFTGVDLVDGRPRRWRVENSWGEEPGRKGFFVMNDGWFDEHVLEIASPRRELSAELQKAFDTEPVILPAWDPMGSLA